MNLSQNSSQVAQESNPVFCVSCMVWSMKCAACPPFMKERTVRGTPNIPKPSPYIPHMMLYNTLQFCDILQFCVIIYIKVAPSCTITWPFCTCCILSTLTIPSLIPLLCHSTAIPFHSYIISHIAIYITYISYSSSISLSWSAVGC